MLEYVCAFSLAGKATVTNTECENKETPSIPALKIQIKYLKELSRNSEHREVLSST